MRAYLLTSGAVFGLLVVAHIIRVFIEGPGVIREPVFAIATILAAGLCLWAVRLLRLPERL
jgi:hypothetical protein